MEIFMLMINEQTKDIKLDERGFLQGYKLYGELFYLYYRERSFKQNPLPVHEKDYRFYLESLLEFTDKDSYLVWIEVWQSAHYNFVTIQRKLKAELRQPHTNVTRSSIIMSQSSILRHYLHSLNILRVEGKKKSALLRQERINRGIAGPDVVAPEEAQNTDGERGREESRSDHARTGFWSSVQRKLAEVILRPMRQGSGIDR